MLEIARRRMLCDYPFHARFVALWRVEASEETETVGVTIRDNAVYLLYNPAFVAACTFPELIGVLVHECHHLVFEHLFIDTQQYKDAGALMIAEEVTANEWIEEPLPGKPILLSQFPELPPDENTLTRYGRLTSGGNESHDPPQSGAERSRKQTAGRQPETEGRGSLSASRAAERPRPLDDHNLWDEARAAGAVGQMALRVLIREAAASLSDEECTRLPESLRRRLKKVCRGHIGGGMRERLWGGGDSALDWRCLLRHYVREALELTPHYGRPPRRFPELVGILPGSSRRPTRASAMAVVDTSGSLSGEQLRLIADELDAMASVHAVTVVECDTKVCAVYPYYGRLTEVQGRGGTDLRPPFDGALVTRLRPDVIIYFTDGNGPAPSRPPTVPVIWCLTASGRKPAVWGNALHMTTGEANI
jgi:predicted metal-dependent peptidase